MIGVSWSKTGCLTIPVKKYEDERGYFTEVFKQSQMEPRFYQDNLSYSYENVVRGMHFQRKNPQGKLVRCLQGRITDVVIDLRRNSPTFMMVETFQLMAHSNDDIAVLIPPGFAHGFMAECDSILFYKCTTEYDPESDTGINPLDSIFDFPWSGMKDIIVSEKDKSLPYFKSIDPYF